jgi:putative transposase
LVSISTRQSWIDWQPERELPIKDQAALLSLNRSGLYYKPKPPSQRELELKRRIDEIYTAWPFYGSRRIKAQLRREGWQVNRKMVQRCMGEMGLAGLVVKPNLSKRGKEHKIYPYLLAGLKISRPRQVFGTDITYIRLKYGWLYLVAVLDWHSRYIVSWELDQTLAIEFVLKAVERAVAGGGPEIFNSDQGSHFTSPKYIQLVQGAGSRVSMDGKGRAFDNIFTERLWKTIKYECVYLNEFETPKEARRVIGEYIEFYNNSRLHQSLGYRTPAQVHFGLA